MKPKFAPVVIAVIAALAGLWLASLWLAPKPVEIQSGTLLNPPRSLANFSLIDDKNQPFNKASLLGHWTLLYSGYTFCPDVCPTTMAMLKVLDANLVKSGHKLSVVFLSIDPARDTPARLATYVHFFNPAFIGVTAEEPALGQFTHMLGIAYLKVPGTTADNYSMDHSSGLILFDPQARMAAYFSAPQEVENLTKDISAVMDARS